MAWHKLIHVTGGLYIGIRICLTICLELVSLHVIMAFTLFFPSSFGMVKSYNMPCAVESASLEPKLGNKFVAGGEDMWIRLFDFHTGDEIGELQTAQSYFYGCLHFCSLNVMSVVIFPKKKKTCLLH